MQQCGAKIDEHLFHVHAQREKLKKEKGAVKVDMFFLPLSASS
jgi:hypothetical protein